MAASDGQSRVLYCRGIVALCGAAVDRAAAGGLAQVPHEWQEQRRRRDGDAGFHVTFLTKCDLQAVAASLRDGSLELPDSAPQPDPSDLSGIADLAAWLLARTPFGGLLWVDVGEGRAKDDVGEAAFRVVLWPAGAAVRRAMGLEPQDFHISLGFRGHDVHGRSKGLPSLVAGAPDAAAVPLLAAAAQQLLSVGPGRDVDAPGIEQLADAAVLGARAHGDTTAEVAALRVLCLLNGRFRRHHDSLAHAMQLLEVSEEDEVGCRSRAFALMALQRYGEARPALTLLQRLVEGLPDDKERAAVRKWLSTSVEKCCAKLGLAGKLFPGPEDAATVEGDKAFEDEFYPAHSQLKFPSTAHLKNLGAATRADKICDPQRQHFFCGSGRLVSVEEKIDGANLGISLDSKWQWRMQGRSKMVNWNTDPQFAGLEQWLNEHSGTLCELLERNNDILFGEWCAARHTVKYTRLPGYFLAFDIYDRRQGRFLSRHSFHTRLQHAEGRPRIPAVPMLCAPCAFASIAEVEALLETRSRFADEVLEGVYLRIDDAAPAEGEESYLLDRCKLVRAEFQQAIEEHGSWRGNGDNGLDMELVVSYAEESYPCAVAHAQQGTAAGVSSSSQAAGTPDPAASSKGKYPSTPHLPFSPGVNPDDSQLADCTELLREEVIVTEKLDGGNCCIKEGHVYARTHAKPATHESFSAVKQLATGFGDALEGIELFGENMQAVHSIEYGNLTSFFYIFAARRQGLWLSWDEVRALAQELGLPTAPTVFRGRFDSPAQLQGCLEGWASEPSAVGGRVTPEGFVVRRLSGFPDGRFADRIAKYVRAGHLQTDDTWTRTWKKAQLGPALPSRAPREPQVLDVLREKLSNPRERHKVTTPGLGEVELPRNFSFLFDDVAVSSTPKNAQQILAMASMDIALVITLTEESPLPPEWFQGTGVQNIFVPVPNFHPPTMPQTDSILAAVAEAVSSGQRAMVHCGGGKGRAGTVAACLMLRFGSGSVSGALAAERACGRPRVGVPQSDDVLCQLRDARPGSVETHHQERFVREFASTLWRRAAEVPEVLPLLRAISAARSGHEEEALLEAQLFNGDGAAAAEDAAQPEAGTAPSRREAPSASSGGAKVKREEREAERRLRDLQKRGPKYIVMAGLAGSGKSTFCKALEASGSWMRASQDDLGRKGCEALVRQQVPLVRRGQTHLVVDRCNLSKDERAEWLDLFGGPPAKEVLCVFFDFDPEHCKRRAAARMDHPTIRSGGGARIIDDQAKKLERPQASEGFGAVEVIQSFEQAGALLRRLGARAAASGAGTAASEAPAPSAAAVGGSSPSGAPVSTGSAAASGASAEARETAEEGALLAEFAEWLGIAMVEELGKAEAAAMLPAVEVILAGAEADPDALASAAEVLRDCGAPSCAERLQARWEAAAQA